ncbi:hypothetical protein HN011_009609 [Eciton burchellii]|nr:hypothetical protein HN011_009609 [Eciton burchellii]
MLSSFNYSLWKELRYKRSAILARKWQISTASSYYVLNRILLLCIGLWPYQTSNWRHTLITFFSITLVSSVVIQLTVFMTRAYSIDLLLQILTYCIPWLIYTLKYNIHCLYINKMRVLLERIQDDWNILNNAREIEIIKKYSAIGRFITLMVMLFIYLSLFGVIVIQLLAIFLLDVGLDVNESHVQQLPILTEYFIDQEKYLFLILFHIFLVVLCGLTTVAATETFYMSLIQHACGLFQIASYRLEQALHKNIIRDVASIIEKNTIICCRINSGINMHKRAIEFVKMIQTSSKWAYLLLLPLGVLSLSMNFYRFSQLITIKQYQEIIISFVFILGHFWYMFFCNYIGQKVIDHSSDIFHRIYNTQWYIAPLKTQKLLLFVMQKSMRHSTIILGGLFVPSLEGFATLASMSLSYFMVIYSVH